MTRKSNAAKNEPRFSFQLGLSGIIALLILTILGMAWSFILGVVVGRGYQPETVAKEIARKVLPEDLAKFAIKPEDALKGEELEFFDKLKQGTGSASLAKSAPPASPATPPKPAAPPAAPAKPDAAKPDTTKAQPATPAAPAPAQQPAKPAPPVKDEVFLFTYQVAALATMDQAQAFLKKMEPGGVKASVVSATRDGKTWYRVCVQHQGTVESALAMKEKLKASGISNAVLQTRTPVKPAP